MSELQVKSRRRVAAHGEVYTSLREVNAMLDLVKQETERVESRFLEPACGNGNFLIEVLRRKLAVVKERYEASQTEYERNAVVAVGSLYGIDILKDNVLECRNRLFEYFCTEYENIFGINVNDDCIKTVRYVIEKNIICGDALTLQTVSDTPKPIIFSEWTPVNETQIKRRDFSFSELLNHSQMNGLPLFSDAGEDVFVPEPVAEFKVEHYLRLYDC
jgi:SAM-dependent methyltransferase